jgi:hypothetical protein
VSWEMVCTLYAPTQAMVGSFSGDGSGCFHSLSFAIG